MTPTLAVGVALLAFSQSTVAQASSSDSSPFSFASVLTLPFYGYDTQSIDASVVTANAQATTLALACPSGTDQNDCGLFPGQTMIIGSNTYAMTMSDADFTGTQVCATSGTTAAVCTESAGGSSANDPGMSTTTYQGSDIAVLPVTVTAGAMFLGSYSGSSPTGTATSQTTSGSASPGSTTLSGHASATGSKSGSAASTSTSNAASTNTMGSGEKRGIVCAALVLLGYLF